MLALILGVAILLPAAALAWLPAPFVWIFLIWTLACFFAAFRRRRTTGARGFLALSAVAFALFLGETILTLGQKEHGPRAAPGIRYRALDPDLGFGPIAGTQAKIESMEHGELLYRATYTIDEDGWRIMPAAEPPVRGAVICLGGSYTFGEGMGDEKTYPWLLAEALDDRYEIHNLSYQGWGAHQMLALIESGRVEEVLEAPLVHAIYIAIPHHVRRAVGLTAWALHAPRYVRNADGTIVRDGMLVDAEEAGTSTDRLTGAVRAQLQKSHVARRLMPRRKATAGDLELYLDIVDEARRKLLAKHPSASWHVLVWDDALQDADAFVAGLEAHGHEVHRASSFLDGLDRPPSKWHLGRWDGHPSAAAAAAISDWAARDIVGDEADTGESTPPR